ncbi:glycerophosphodiester phosphodiesterase family protein [Dactylococcopsis salina]|uniref:glycerophosphodiester phosphodiesterase n=1 Tax=Dactylococcopsis salina (strain PCC 8305) TaxID=13035 RepID=K9YUJ8_DACS8|nr:glycerophosphodiester phosphodiesterase family protein [Dactylococcopsis salina]AFZ49773.1 Glycerophosphoryl diester phosphodiesterase family [Dactylococcopsis salina PCC 8305]
MLKGFAVLPAETFAEGPNAGEGIAANGFTGPFDGQPVQGFSGVQFAPTGDGRYWFLSDNGFGAEENSSDYLLRIYELDPNFAGTENGDRSVAVEDFIQLSDPDNLISFSITNEGTSQRLLTGADFDIESFVIDGDGDIWVGDEFGPYMLHFNAEGELLEAPIATPNFPDLNTLNGQDPLVIGHRGASGDFPEHTLASYKAAIAQGADFVEPDLVTTSDGVLIARHEPMLDNTTNVAEVFPERQMTKTLDGEEVTAYFAEDFTLEEIKQLRAVQSRDFRDPAFDGQLEIPTFQEVIELVQEVEANTGKEIGIYPETKHPTFFDQQGLSLEEPLIQTLQDTGFTDPNRIFIQSFEFQNLIELQETLDQEGLGDIPLVQLYGNTTDSASPDSGFSVPYDIRFNVEQGNDLAAIYGQDFLDAVENPLSEDTIYSDLDSAEFLQVIGEQYAEGAGPWKNNFLLRESLETPVDGNGDGEAEITSQLTGEVTSFVDDAHNAGLQVHPYTLRDEERFLTLEEDGTPQTPTEEFEQLINIGVDGFFTDFPRTGDPVRDAMVSEDVRSPQHPDFDFNTLTSEPPLVIAHRGASGDLPEHTLEGYRTAILQGADFVEPDLVTTSDGVLIARHEPMLDNTTNVAEVFPERQMTKTLDGEEVTAYFAEDFTLEEIKQLRAVQPREFRDQSFNGEFEIPTFQEVIELVQEVEAETGIQVGIYPETKHPTFFDEQGLSLEEPLIQTLQDTGFTDPNRIFIQSFEFQNLIELQETLDQEGLGDIPLVQLYGNTTDSASPDSGFSVPYDIRFNVEQGNDLAAIYGQDFLDAVENPLSEDTIYSDLDSAEFLQVIGEQYAEGAGPWKNNFLLRESLETPVDGNGDGEAEITSQLTGEVTSFVDDAHNAGLQVHPYTLRNEERFLTLEEDGTPQTPGEEFEQLIEIGVDGFFTDFPATGSMVLETLVEEPNLPRSRGFEGMAFSPDRNTAYPLLEGEVTGDPDNSRRIYEFDLNSGEYQGIVGFYGVEEPNHAIGDFTPINENEFLVIERDGSQADLDGFKKVFKVDFSNIDENGFVEKEEVVDLLNIPDPDDLNGDGETTYTMPFVTIEDVLVLDENTILVANDNNFPFSVGRPPEIDNNEIALIELDEPLDLDPRLGVNAEAPTAGTPIFGSLEADTLDAGVDFIGEGDLVFSGAGEDTIDASTVNSNNRLYGGSDADELVAGSNDRLFGGTGNDRLDASVGNGGNRLYGGAGADILVAGNDDRLIGNEGDDQFFFPNGGANNVVTGGTGADLFQIKDSDVRLGTNTITDFTSGEDSIGVAGVEASFADITRTAVDNGTLLSLDGEDLAVLLGVEANSLTEADFTFG